MIRLNTYSVTARNRRGWAQQGLSLVELMVGLTIGLVLTLGLFTLISNQSTTFKTQDDFARMQENGATALRYIGDSVRMAGFYGYTMDPANIDTTIGGVAMSGGATDDCGPPASNWALNVAVPISGFPGLTAATVNAQLPCILAANFLDVLPGGQQVLITRSAAGYRICNALVAAAAAPPDCTNPASLLAAQPNFATTVYLQGDPNGGFLFYGGAFAATAAPPRRKLPPLSVNDVDIFEYRAHVYYLRPCSRPAGGGANCIGAGDDLVVSPGSTGASHPIPTLVRQELIGSKMTEVPLVEGIERIDFRYGIDTSGDGIADSFTTTPAAANWANVVSVKVSVLVRSPTLSAQQDDSSKSYDLDGDGVVDYRCIDFVATDPNACHYKRKVFSQIFQLRNIAQRRGA
jgi:type IV pilus assembly protein PilW